MALEPCDRLRRSQVLIYDKFCRLPLFVVIVGSSRTLLCNCAKQNESKSLQFKTQFKLRSRAESQETTAMESCKPLCSCKVQIILLWSQRGTEVEGEMKLHWPQCDQNGRFIGLFEAFGNN